MNRQLRHRINQYGNPRPTSHSPTVWFLTSATLLAIAVVTIVTVLAAITGRLR